LICHFLTSSSMWHPTSLREASPCARRAFIAFLVVATVVLGLSSWQSVTQYQQACSVPVSRLETRTLNEMPEFAWRIWTPDRSVVSYTEAGAGCETPTTTGNCSVRPSPTGDKDEFYVVPPQLKRPAYRLSEDGSYFERNGGGFYRMFVNVSKWTGFCPLFLVLFCTTVRLATE